REGARVAVEDAAQTYGGRRVADVLLLSRGMTQRSSAEKREADDDRIVDFAVGAELALEHGVAETGARQPVFQTLTRRGAAEVRIDALSAHGAHGDSQANLHLGNGRERREQVCGEEVLDDPYVFLLEGVRRAAVRQGLAASHHEGIGGVVGEEAERESHIAVG